jgi:Fuc2NAc and GlcNAc transferase
MRVGPSLVGFGRFAPLLGMVGIIWVLNLFNFMDGIDGIAASEAAFMSFAGGALASGLTGTEGFTLVTVGFGAACLGFLVFNWSPARIFMGDVGSGFLGFLLAVFAIWIASSDPVGLLVWLILGGVFFVDATVTLLRRLWRRERVLEAHRTHAYQWLARRWKSHGKVSGAVVATNLVWLTPWALAARFDPAKAAWYAVAALLPLLVVAIWAGSGRAESADSAPRASE